MPTLFVAWRNLGPVGDLGDVDKLTWQHFKGNPHHLHRLAHSPSPPGTHTCAWVRASLGCQSEPRGNPQLPSKSEAFPQFQVQHTQPTCTNAERNGFPQTHTRQKHSHTLIYSDNMLQIRVLSWISLTINALHFDRFDHKCFLLSILWLTLKAQCWCGHLNVQNLGLIGMDALVYAQ